MVKPEKELKIGSKKISLESPAFFIADIAANHDGNLERAKELIYLAKEAGADAAKFQHFKAETIVNDSGFKELGSQKSHQAKWIKPVYEVYREASVSMEWTSVLKETCDKAGIIFFTSPYSLELVDHVDPFVPAYKIGSGDITWLDIVGHIASKGKPTIIAAGASNLEDVVRAMDYALSINPSVALLQCNTNYTASLENFKYINLNVLKTFSLYFPDMVLGLSDHTPGFTTVLGAISLGARIIEKHFTDDKRRSGPDHPFSMDPKDWKEMVIRARELESALGNGRKVVEVNEKDTVVLQRRSVCLIHPVEKGEMLTKKHLICLRPCPHDGIEPFRLSEIVGMKSKKDFPKGYHLRWQDLISE